MGDGGGDRDENAD